jgi:hypothetical protein
MKKQGTKFKFLRSLEDKTKNPNALKLLKEIEHLFDIGNELRANALLRRYSDQKY